MELSLQESILWARIVADYAYATTTQEQYLLAADSILGSLHAKQYGFVTDPSRRKAAICPRRSGKSYAAMAACFNVCLRRTNRNTVIITLTLGHAKSIYWTAMQHFAAMFGLELRWNAHELKVYFKNGSTITLVGGESRTEIEKLRGSGYDLVVIDECASFLPSVLEYAMEDVIGPALTDRKGTVAVIGTPGNVLKGLFYNATAPGAHYVVPKTGLLRPYSRTFDKPEAFWRDRATDSNYWSRHAWTALDNDRVPHLWEEFLLEKESQGWPDDHPKWRREYLAEWVPATSVYVYEFANLVGTDPGRVLWEPRVTEASKWGLDPAADWRFVAGLDFGFNDDWAIVVFAYNGVDRTLWHVFDYKANHQDLDVIGQKLLQVNTMFGGFDAIVGDFGGLGLVLLETLNNRHGLNIQKAEKREKFDHIELFNSDFLTGRVKIIAASDYADELANHQWLLEDGDDKTLLARQGKLKENPALPNHLCDAGLYAWRFCMHYWAVPAGFDYAVGTPEWQTQQLERAMAGLLAKRTPHTFTGPRSVLDN